MDQTKIDAFAERIFGEVLTAMAVLNVYLGHRLGLFRALMEGPATPAELAKRAGCVERYVREWLECMAVQDYVTHDQGTGRFALPREHAAVLVDRDHPSYAAALACFVPSLGGVLPQLLQAFRTGGGVPYEAYGADVLEAIAFGNRPMFVNDYVARWLPALPDVVTRLEAGARVADIGCGLGWSSIALARAFPKTRIDAVDVDEASIAEARRQATEAGVADRIAFHRSAVEDAPLRGPYDLVTAFECLHDMPYPVRALRRMRELAGPGGAVLVADEGGRGQPGREPQLRRAAQLQLQRAPLPAPGARLPGLRRHGDRDPAVDAPPLRPGRRLRPGRDAADRQPALAVLPIDAIGASMTSQVIPRASCRSERRLCRRNRFLEEVSEGARIVRSVGPLRCEPALAVLPPHAVSHAERCG